MADLCIDVQSNPSTPSSGQAVVFVDSVAKILSVKDDTGRTTGFSFKTSVADQAGFAADTYVTGSGIIIPTYGFQAQTNFLWKISASKTGAGIAQPIYNIR